MIHVCYGLYDKDGRYSKFIGVSMLSIFENTKESVTIHILHDYTLTVQNREKFLKVAKHYNQYVEFHNVEDTIADKIAQIKEELPKISTSRYTIASLYLLLVAEIVDVEKVIYLDADILVNLDIADLWHFDITNYPLAAVPELEIYKLLSGNNYLFDMNLVNRENYFNSGVLLLNLKFFRDKFNIIYKGYKFICDHPQCTLFDQDILNYCFSENYLKLSRDFNRIVLVERFAKRINQLQKAIYHYAMNAVQLDTMDVYNRLFIEFFVKTPWFNIDMLNNIFDSVQKIYNDNKNLLIQMMKLISGRKRAFFTEERNVEALKQICGIKNDEQIILADKIPNSINELVNFLMKSKKQVIIFVFIGNYKLIHDILIQCKLVENVDFVNGNLFLPDRSSIRQLANLIQIL